MSLLSTADPTVHQALASCVAALRQLANYELEPSLEHHLQELGERKEFLDPRQHEELRALVRFAQRRTKENLESALAQQRHHQVFPELRVNP
jgi:hypothetical protein